MKMADGTIIRRNRPGTKAKVDKNHNFYRKIETSVSSASNEIGFQLLLV